MHSKGTFISESDLSGARLHAISDAKHDAKRLTRACKLFTFNKFLPIIRYCKRLSGQIIALNLCCIVSGAPLARSSSCVILLPCEIAAPAKQCVILRTVVAIVAPFKTLVSYLRKNRYFSQCQSGLNLGVSPPTPVRQSNESSTPRKNDRRT